MITTNEFFEQHLNKKNECEECFSKTNKPLVRFGGRMICPDCIKKIEKGFDVLEMKGLIQRRGKKWIQDILDKIRI